MYYAFHIDSLKHADLCTHYMAASFVDNTNMIIMFNRFQECGVTVTIVRSALRLEV